MAGPVNVITRWYTYHGMRYGNCCHGSTEYGSAVFCVEFDPLRKMSIQKTRINIIRCSHSQPIKSGYLRNIKDRYSVYNSISMN